PTRPSPPNRSSGPARGEPMPMLPFSPPCGRGANNLEFSFRGTRCPAAGPVAVLYGSATFCLWAHRTVPGGKYSRLFFARAAVSSAASNTRTRDSAGFAGLPSRAWVFPSPTTSKKAFLAVSPTSPILDGVNTIIHVVVEELLSRRGNTGGWGHHRGSG